MAKSRATSGNNAQFTYDFGIAIAQSTVNKITRLTGATLSLASAFYALKSTASEYVDTLKENTLRFGGVLSTMKAIEQAQNRLIKGQSYFSMDDQLRGMNQLMAVGIDVGENLEWINKAAHATGKSYSEFAGMIASAIQGNSQALVDAGLMTQRATRIFDKYQANTIMRQQAILNFVKNHKGLMNAVKNDFETIQDQMVRIKGIWKTFLQSIVGKPNDPQSFYGQIVSSTKMVAEALSRNMTELKRYGYIIGQTLGWIVKQVGHFVVWVGRQVKKALESVWKVTDDFQNQSRSLLVWLEFWKLKIVDFFKEYGDEIKGLLKLLLAYKALKTVFVIGNDAIASVRRYRKAIIGTFALRRRYVRAMGDEGNKFARWLQSLAVFMPKWFRKAYTSIGRLANRVFFGKAIQQNFWIFLGNLKKGFKLIWKGLKILQKGFTATNPVGWIILAISLLVTLYKKVDSLRVLVNGWVAYVTEQFKLIWNSIMYIYTWIKIGFKKFGEWFMENIWNPASNFFESIGNWISDMWNKLMNNKYIKWLNDNIIEPIGNLFSNIGAFFSNVWNKLTGGFGNIANWIGEGNTKLSNATEELAKEYGVDAPRTFKGGTYNPYDDTDYMGVFKNKLFGGKKDNGETVPENPLITAPALATSGAAVATTSMNFENGAIQINVQKGEGIDERILAQKIKGVLNDMRREGDMRGGTV